MNPSEAHAAAKAKTSEHARHIAELVRDGREVHPDWIAAYREARDAEQAAWFAAKSAERDAMALTLVQRAVAS